MTNPYKLVFSLYLDDIRSILPIFRNKEVFYRDNFNIWIDDFFNKRDFNQEKITGKTKKVLNVICDISEQESIIFGCDNIVESIEKIENIVNSPIWTRGSIQKCFDEIEVKEFNFNEMYDIAQAKKIYLRLKRFFDICEHDPFSFTTNELSDIDKMKFLHDIL